MDIIKGVEFSFWFELGLALSLVGIGFWFGRIKKFIRSKGLFEKTWNEIDKIHELLTELRVKTRACRVQLIQFHNGGQFIDGISMKRFSLSYESLSKGVSREENFKDVLVSLFPHFISKIIKNSPEMYYSHLEEASIFRQILQHSNVIMYSVLPVRSKGRIIGALVLNWCNRTRALEDPELVVAFKETRDLVELGIRTISDQES